ncbi:MAG: hypothetical protein EXR17_07445 [Flavobacteriaceae bacterium]|nr:hypothetical protein [Flavobacteriaceae bacterium]
MKNSPVKTFGWQLIKAITAGSVVVLYSRLLGSEGRGKLSILLLDLQLILMVSELVAGSALANLLIRYSQKRILPTAWISLLLVLFIGYRLGMYLNIPQDFLHVLFLQGMFLGGLNIQYNIYQANEWIYRRNPLQWGLEIIKLCLLGVVFVFGTGTAEKISTPMAGLFPTKIDLAIDPNVYGILAILALSSGLIWLISVWKTRGYLKGVNGFTLPPKEMFQMGLGSQLGHVLLFLLYRLPLWFVASRCGSAQAGVFANAFLMADTLWVFANSFGTILHSRILGRENHLFRMNLVARYMLLSALGTLLMILGIIMVPNFVFVGIFGNDFSGLKENFILITPAILCLALSAPLGHYLHATNRFKTLIVSNAVAVLIFVMVGFVLDPQAYEYRLLTIDNTPRTMVILGICIDHYHGLMIAVNTGFFALLAMNWFAVKPRFRKGFRWNFIRRYVKSMAKSSVPRLYIF